MFFKNPLISFLLVLPPAFLSMQMCLPSACNLLTRHLQPENILCLSKSGNRVKIIDLGLARKFEPMKKLQILFGTPEFVAPEVVNFEPIGYSTDMWALGVITYVL